MSISIDSLRNLPEGASFQKRSGQANASVFTQGNNVVVTATCDSLQREVELYAELYVSTLEELEEMRESTEEREEKGCRHTPILTTILALAAGIIVGTAATLIIKTARNG
ncbi:MAG: hypothetical protein J1E16_09645 [Muribaculaceae bacterium]|nr:hypothetical protein [Muribaculaceae bacterium]